MRNLLVLALVLFGLECLGQRQALLGYRYNGVSEVKRFLTDSLTAETSKAVQFKNFLFLKTGESNLDKLFSKIKIGSVDTTLLGKSYQNSCWVLDTNMIRTYLGQNRWCKYGIAYYYHPSGGRIELWIVDCGNEITFLFPLSKNDEPYVAPPKVQIVLVDTVHLKVYVYDSVPTPECDTCCPISYVTNITYYGDGERYQPYQSGFYSGWLGYQWGWYSGGGQFREDHQCRITNNYTTNNSWTYNDSQIILPTPKPEPGGRVTPPGSGGPLIQPGHDDPGGGHITPPGDGIRKVPPPHGDPDLGEKKINPGHEDLSRNRVTNQGHSESKSNSSLKINRSEREETLPALKSRVAKKIEEKRNKFNTERSRTETKTEVRTERSRPAEPKTFSPKTDQQRSRKENVSPSSNRRESPARRTDVSRSSNYGRSSNNWSRPTTQGRSLNNSGGSRPTSSGSGTRSSGSRSTSRGAR